MATQKHKRPPVVRRRARLARLDFAALEITGALLTPDMVVKIASFDAGDQSKDGYGIPLGLDLRDEIARYYRIGEALWSRSVATRAPAAHFVANLLKQCFGFDTLHSCPPSTIDGRAYPLGHSALGGRVPIVIAPAPANATGEPSRRPGVDESLAEFGDGSRRRSATLLVQEFLNASEPARWGLACDGVILRLMRDNASMTRPAWVEVNLGKIFSESLYADFSALWLLVHQSRFGAAGSPPGESALETWWTRGRDEGVAAREHLRNGVTEALKELGQGFLENPGNDHLRRALASGALSPQAYYEELLRLVYRMIFLFVAEDRLLLHSPDSTAAARELYAQGYAMGRLRERSMRRTAWDRHQDAWEGVKAAYRALACGEARLGLSSLGGLFASDQLQHLGEARLQNRRLLAAVWRLSWLRPAGGALTRVNWRDMQAEELGSVYESLLELIPRASADTRLFDFAPTAEARGSERKKTGSYYTPDSLVKLLLDTTLDPVLDAAEARNPDDPAAEILKLSIIDPACGSGHFLLGAARRAAGRIAKWRSPGAPSQAEFQHALREVISHCIYGVDRNPMAVELCRVALWIEGLEAGKPLTFLTSHIRVGDSLLGVFDFAMLRQGIPDEAYAALTGDDKDVAKAFQRWNAEGRDRDRDADSLAAELRPPNELIGQATAFFAMPEDTLEQVAQKRAAYEELHATDAWRRFERACNCYVSAYLVPKRTPVLNIQDDWPSPVALTEHVWAAIRGNGIPALVDQYAEAVQRHSKLFHWLLEFPDIFARGGFDVVIGNPPWERIKLQELEFFAARSPEIAEAPNKAERQKRIDALRGADSESPQGRLLISFEFAKRTAEAASKFARTSGRFPLTGTGDVNTYALFAELFDRLTAPAGRAGIIVPTGIATDSSTSAFFGSLVDRRRIASLTDFENREALFENVHRSYKFCILSMGAAEQASFAFFLAQVSELEDPERRFTLDAAQIARMNPNTKTAPVFRSRADAELTAKLYARAPVLIEERPDHADGDANPWGISFQTLFHMSGDSGHFRTQDQLDDEGWQRAGVNWERETEAGVERRVPLYEAKMIHHFDHRWATYAGGAVDDEDSARDCTLAEKQDPNFEPTARYWVPQQEVVLRAARVPSALKRAFRDEDPDRCLKALAEALAGYSIATEGRPPREELLHRVLGATHPWRTILKGIPEKILQSPETLAHGFEMQRYTPLSADDLLFLADGPEDALELTQALIERKQPRWLMGFRDICRSTDDRTVIAGVIPRAGVGHTAPLFYLQVPPQFAAISLGLWSSLSLDFVARLSIGGTHLTYSYLKQFAVLPPSAFDSVDSAFVTPRVLELTYTSHSMKAWAEDLGYLGAPFAWNEDRRALVRAELDAFFARKYGLSREELRYVLDPADVKGSSYPSETFRVLKNKEEARYGEYRTRRLVLEAWDRLENV